MKTLVLEVRDRGTFIPVLALPLTGNGIRDYYLHKRCGYPRARPGPAAILLVHLISGQACNDPMDWGEDGSRTMGRAHEYIQAYFNDLQDGDVIDVQFILGETTTKKTSERLSSLRTGE